MLNQKFTPSEAVDQLFDFSGGINAGLNPLLLPRNQLANASNVTLRGSFATHRPPYRKITLNYGGDAALQEAVEKHLFQAACFYKPDSGGETLRGAIAGRLFEFTPSATTATVVERTTIPTRQSATARQQWIWQAEKWTIWNDGTSLPVFTDATTSVRSGGTAPLSFAGTLTASFKLALPGSAIAGGFTVAPAPPAGMVDSVISINNIGTFTVTAVVGFVLSVTVKTVRSILDVGITYGAGHQINWSGAAVTGVQLPVGRMGVYGMGRNWMALADGKQFIASDLVGGSSGTVANNYRDAVLNITENGYLAGGGTFTVPGGIGDIRAMRFTATLDASLGQGALQVLTPNGIFSCNAPVDRLEWQDLVNPILTESLISNGGLSQNATVSANGDIIFRSIDGIRSLILGRREFNTWGNVPSSFEVDPILNRDSVDLLPYASAIVFDNRLLLTTQAVLHDQGVYFKALVPLNFDPLSSLRGKAPSIYDSLIWTGLNVLQLVVGQFGGVERAFAFCLNTVTSSIELYELLKQRGLPGEAIYDNDSKRITWTLESPVLFGRQAAKDHDLMRLIDGEIYVSDLVGSVDFQAWYKPDQWPCWVPWFAWSECAETDSDNSKPQFRPRMGLGMPSPEFCDETNNRPLREAHTFQVRLVITGHCLFIGGRFKTVTVPQTEFAKPSCCTRLLTPADMAIQ